MTKEDRYYSIFTAGPTHVGLEQKREIVDRIRRYGIALDVREASIKDYDDKFMIDFNEKWLHGWAERLLEEWPFLKEGKYEGLLDFILLDLFQATAATITDENKAVKMTSKEASAANQRLQKFISENGPMGLILAWGFHINYRILTALSQGLHEIDALIEFVYACDKRLKTRLDAGWQVWTKIIEWILSGVKAKGTIDENGKFSDYGKQVMQEYREIFGLLKDITPAYDVSNFVFVWEGTFPFFRQLGTPEDDDPWDEEDFYEEEDDYY